MATKTSPKTWPGIQHATAQSRAPWAGVIKFLDELVRLLPSYKDTKRGRSRAMQFRGAVIGVGVLVAAFAGRDWIVFGVFMMTLALVLPVSVLRKRMMRAKLKAARTLTITKEVPVELVFDGRRLAVNFDGKMERRVLVNREHKLVEGQHQGRRLVVLKSGSKKKREHIWLTSSENGNGDIFTDDDVYMPVVLTPEHLNQVVELIEAL